MNIAIIDSKINPLIINNDFNCNNTYDVINFTDYNDVGETDIFHADMVINTIIKYLNVPLHFYVYSVTDIKNNGNSIYVIEALKDILTKNDIKIVIMSLTISNEKNNKEIQKICNEISESGKFILAANGNNENIECYPAKCNNVIGVNRGSFLKHNDFCFNKNKNIQVIGDASPEFIKISNGNFKLFGGTSKATPKMIKHIYDGILQGANNYILMQEYLEDKSCHEKNNILKICNNPIINDTHNTNFECLKIIINNINTILGKSLLTYESLIKEDKSVFEIIDNEDILIKLINNILLLNNNNNVNIDEIHFNNFKSVHSLARFIYNKNISL